MRPTNELDVARLREIISDRDAGSLADRLTAMQFVLIHIEEAADEGDGLGALTADIENHPYLVAFSSQQHATHFVNERSDVFNSDEEVGGFLVDGATVLDYLSPEFGLLINPEGGEACSIDPELIADVLDELGLDQ